MSKQLIQEAVASSLQSYFNDLGSEPPADVYAMMLEALERPLLTAVMQKANQNQSKAAQWLGLNRNTLRKKLQHYQMAD